MIAVSSLSGSLIKVLPSAAAGAEALVYGFHPVFGLIREDTLAARVWNRRRRGIKTPDHDWTCLFSLSQGPQGAELEAIEDCTVHRDGDGEWLVKAFNGATFRLGAQAALDPQSINERSEAKEKELRIATGLVLSLFLLFVLFPKGEVKEEQPEILEQVTVEIKQEVRKAVTVPEMAFEKPADMKPEEAKTKQEVKRAIHQNLGFLTLLGNKNVTKVLGGQRQELKEATAGAGPGGTAGSGGEVLVGLGQGLTRVTVGNTGTKGLGGVGTKGAGGGLGGYGNSMVGSGEGKALSSVPLSDEMVLEGGLSRSAIQATIAKYLSQVRACYERELKNAPNLAGTVSMFFEINGDGTVNSAQVKNSTVESPKVGSCISNSMLGWQFPKPVGNVKVKVNYPFLLRPLGT